MDSKSKKIIYDILLDFNLTVEEKFNKIMSFFPNYLDKTDEKKAIYEKIEWIFHDGLWTYFELLVFDEIVDFYSINIEKSYKTIVFEKIEIAKNLYKKFFPNNQYNLNFDDELKNIKNWAKKSLEIIREIIGNEEVIDVKHSFADFRNGNARDIFVILKSGIEKNFSLKTDKSWKVALFDGQTRKIFEKVYNRYFNLSLREYEELKRELFNTTNEFDIFKDFQNIALLTQSVLIKQFSLKNVSINNFKNAIITNNNNFIFFIKQLKVFKNGEDNSFVLYVDRLTGSIGFESILDRIDEVNINLDDFSFTPCVPRWYKYATEPWIKYKWKTFISFQTKHKRWKNPSLEFWDITIRLRSQ